MRYVVRQPALCTRAAPAGCRGLLPSPPVQNSSTYPYSSVGLLLGKGEDRSRLICSGTLISGRVVLTAGQ